MSDGIPPTAPLAPQRANRRNAAKLHTHRLAVNASWLLRLRWVAITGQLLTIGAAYLLLPQQIRLPPLLSIVVFAALTNILLGLSTRRLRLMEEADQRAEWQLAAVMVLDILMLTALLMFTGGPNNPFAMFYLVNLALAAVLLPRHWSWPLGGIAVACFCCLLFWYQAIPPLQQAAFEQGGAWGVISLYQLGFFLGLIICAIVIVYFVTRVTGELQLREHELREAESARARAQRLEALATLAAGAGHELASPLSTIAVVANELERHLASVHAPQAVLDDVQLVRTELARCRTILNRMTTDAGQVAGDALRRLVLQEVLEESLRGLPFAGQIQLRLAEQDRNVCLFAPLQGLAQAIRAVAQNAHDASPADAPIEILARAEGDQVRIEVRDRGEGMSPEVAARAGEPFFTTKEPGQGTGLGLFLTRSVIERLGGQLSWDCSAHQGTTVRIRLPRCQ